MNTMIKHWEPSHQLNSILQKSSITNKQLMGAIMECYGFLLGKKEFSDPILKQHLKKENIDLENPSKRSLLKLVDTLDETALSFNDKKNIHRSKTNLVKFINRCHNGSKTVLVELNNENDIVVARNEGMLKAKDMGFNKIDCNKISTAISELARNIILYVGRGTIEMKFTDKYGRDSLEITAVDEGEGIDNIEEVLSGIYKSKSGMGMGILGSKRLMDEFTINTDRNGTKIVCAKHLRY